MLWPNDQDLLCVQHKGGSLFQDYGSTNSITMCILAVFMNPAHVLVQGLVINTFSSTQLTGFWHASKYGRGGGVACGINIMGSLEVQKERGLESVSLVTEMAWPGSAGGVMHQLVLEERRVLGERATAVSVLAGIGAFTAVDAPVILQVRV